jgi:hypothetical protein
VVPAATGTVIVVFQLPSASAVVVWVATGADPVLSNSTVTVSPAWHGVLPWFTEMTVPGGPDAGE